MLKNSSSIQQQLLHLAAGLSLPFLLTRSVLVHLAKILFNQTWRMLVITSSLVAGAVWCGAVLKHEDRTRYTVADVGSVSVIEQLLRARSIGPVDVLFIGDSSCLMNIDPGALGRRLGKRVASLCSVGLIGPAGYAHLLREYADSGSQYQQLVVVLHPETLLWDATLVWWTEWVKRGGPPDAPDAWSDRLVNGLRFIEAKYLGQIVRIPMQGSFALYYGSIESTRATVQGTGTLVQPDDTLRFASMSQFLHWSSQADRSDHPFNELCKRYRAAMPNEPFNRSLEGLSATLQAMPSRPTKLLLSPVPHDCMDPLISQRLETAKVSIAQRLGSSANIRTVDAPLDLPSSYFGTVSHLNIYGRQLYTELLADLI
jgi:hypothetical protein